MKNHRLIGGLSHYEHRLSTIFNMLKNHPRYGGFRRNRWPIHSRLESLRFQYQPCTYWNTNEYKNIDPYPFMPCVNKDGFTKQHWGFKDLAWRHKEQNHSNAVGKRMSNPTKSYKPSSISRHVKFLDELLKFQSLQLPLKSKWTSQQKCILDDFGVSNVQTNPNERLYRLLIIDTKSIKHIYIQHCPNMEDTLKLQFDGKKILFFELGILVLLFFQTPHG